jgi:cellulose biosynthesis protein BcsQ
MKSICFFNNKGGVGKTTLICNIASYISIHRKRRVLLVDADPQCNSTQLILPEEELEELYQPKRPRKSPARRGSAAVSLYDVLQPIAKGEAHIAKEVSPLLGSHNRFRLDLIPGHPRVALLEDQLSQAWVTFGGGDPGGARKTNWNTQRLALLAERYDLVFFDVGPSLGALNRSVLVGVNYFVTPMGCDIFSMAGVDNISLWLNDWLKWYARSIEACKQKWPEDEFEGEAIQEDTSRIARFIGYTVQQYITKSIQGERRPTKAYEKILQRIPEAVSKELGPFAAPGVDLAQLHLGDVPNMFSLVPLAQSANAPITDLGGSDGLVGTQYSQRETYVGFIDALADNLVATARPDHGP